MENKPIQRFMVATFLWESTLAGLRPFMMLYFTQDPRLRRPRSARLLFGLVGVTYMVAALASGYLADRYGRFRLMRVGLVVFFGGCMLGFFMRDIKWAFIFLPIFGLGGSIVLDAALRHPDEAHAQGTHRTVHRHVLDDARASPTSSRRSSPASPSTSPTSYMARGYRVFRDLALLTRHRDPHIAVLLPQHAETGDAERVASEFSRVPPLGI